MNKKTYSVKLYNEKLGLIVNADSEAEALRIGLAHRDANPLPLYDNNTKQATPACPVRVSRYVSDEDFAMAYQDFQEYGVVDNPLD